MEASSKFASRLQKIVDITLPCSTAGQSADGELMISAVDVVFLAVVLTTDTHSDVAGWH